MNPTALPYPIRYQTTIDDVREVILAGTADPSFWQEKLLAEGLWPFLVDNRAQITITAISSKFRGLRFEEMTIAIAACERDGASAPDGFYLAHAFNSRRLFALAERTLFRTPYYPGAIAVQEQMPASVNLRLDDQAVFSAAMSGARERLHGGAETWEGGIYLPRRMTRRKAAGERFFARMGGFTEVYPFLPEIDLCEIRPRNGDTVLQWLLDSRFTPGEWRLRGQATHARSQTYSRTAKSGST